MKKRVIAHSAHFKIGYAKSQIKVLLKQPFVSRNLLLGSLRPHPFRGDGVSPPTICLLIKLMARFSGTKGASIYFSNSCGHPIANDMSAKILQLFGKMPTP